ncbi:type II secretion system protein N [Colwelliaceae bacterium 6441]
MKKRLATITGFISIYLMFLFILMPANVVVKWLKLPSNIAVGSITGSVWHNQITAVKFNDVVINDIEVKLSFLSLLTLDPQLDIAFGDALVSGPEGTLSVDGLLSVPRIFNAKISLSANTIAQQLNLPIPIQAHDFIDVALEEFVVGKAICQSLSGEINWSAAAVTAIEQKVKLGKLSANLDCQQGDVILDIVEGNDIGLSFSATIGQGFSASGDGYLTPNEKMPTAIKQVLPFLGKADNQGRYRLRF